MEYKNPHLDFSRLGVAPPSTDIHGKEEDRDHALEHQFKATHNWKQRGNFLVCTACPNEHGYPIPTNHLFMGMVEGQPTFKKVKL